ncbi:phasin family protein [Undibacter mobilis]|uniref:Phasin n=1 Tax=Undibacter mobilis TaxID=2292256 RepID=A0A371BAM1_9BRAD|nr:phasin family protein [Undibacter mobilis]RDV04620.1 phasin [Undibacter mobilis]
MAQDPKFEIPAEMREFAEKSVEQAKVAFDSFIAASKHAVGTAETQAKTLQSGVREAGQLAMGFAERNLTASFDFAQRLLRAKDPKEVTELQIDYVKAQIAALSEQAKALSEHAGKMTPK